MDQQNLEVRRGGRRARRAPDAPATFREITPTQTRRVIAQRLTEAKYSAPHFYVSKTCDIGEIVKLRRRLKVEEPNKVRVHHCVEIMRKPADLGFVEIAVHAPGNGTGKIKG